VSVEGTIAISWELRAPVWTPIWCRPVPAGGLSLESVRPATLDPPQVGGPSHEEASGSADRLLEMQGQLVRTTNGRWITKPPTRCPNGHPLGPNEVLVGHQACLGTAADTPHGPADAAIRPCTGHRSTATAAATRGPATVRISTKRGWEFPKAASCCGPDCCGQGRELGGRFSHFLSRRT
jgi:hypothetical protein